MSFEKEWNKLAEKAHGRSKVNGFWDEIERLFPDTVLNDEMRGILNSMKNGLMIALIHSELSEGLDALREGNPPDDKIPEFTGAEAELADVVIRLMDLSYCRGWDVGAAIEKKMAFNNTRSYKHGKQF